jgi:hypothetical protein
MSHPTANVAPPREDDPVPFAMPPSYGKPKWITQDTPTAIAVAFGLIVSAVALVLAILLRPMPPDGTPPGDETQVQIQAATLGTADPQLAVSDPTEAAQSGRRADAATTDVEQMVEVHTQTPTGNVAVPLQTPRERAEVQRVVTEIAQGGAKLGDAIKAIGDDLYVAKLSGTRGLSGIFEVPSHVKSVVYVLDKSGSMSGVPLNAVKAELIAALKKMSTDQKFYVFFYDDTAWPMYTGMGTAATGQTSTIKLETPTPDIVIKATTWISGIGPGGGTNPVPAMLAAIDAKPDLIVLLSDGMFDPGYPVQIDATNVKVRQSNKRINCVGISEQVIPTLHQIAKDAGGVYYVAAAAGP